MNEITDQSTTPKPKRKHRFKIEFMPPLLTLPFVAIFAYILLSNTTYFALINSTLAGVLGGLELNYVAILLALIFSIGGISLLFILIHIRKPTFLLIPLAILLPTLFIAIFVAVVLVITRINVRINLDYIFFMLGPETGLIVYLAVTLGVLFFTIVIILALPPLWNLDLAYTKNPVGEASISAEKSKARHRMLSPYPHFATVMSVLSTLMSFGVLVSLAFYYPLTNIYIANIKGIFQLYVNWLAWPVVIYVVAVVIAFGLEYGIRSKGKAPEQKNISQAILLSLAKVIVGITAIIALILAALMLTEGMPAGMQIMGFYFALGLAPFLIIAFLPSIKQYITRITTKRPKIRTIVVLGLILVPYWFVFYQPLVAGPPQIYLSPSTQMVNLNGIPVPFQNNTVYPNFEWQSNASRQYLNLSGDWKIQKYNISSPYTLSPRTPEILAKLTDGEHLATYDDSAWGTAYVPGAASQYEDMEKYWGTIWYRRTVDIPAEFARKDLLLKFLGANYITDVWIDSVYLGVHEGGFTPFVFDITNICTPGSHIFAIRVDNPEWDAEFTDKTVPDHGDFFNYGGIVREFFIEACQIASIQRLDVRLKDFETINHVNGNADIEIDAVIKCPPPGTLGSTIGNLKINIFPLQFPDNISMMSRETWEFADFLDPVMLPFSMPVALEGLNNTAYTAVRIPITLYNIDFWSTKQPNLYAVFANLTWEGGNIDQFCTQTGFRNITVDGVSLMLNGAPLKLAGASIHEQYPAPVGRTLSDLNHFWDLECVNATGSNWWRGSYPFHPISYIYSDRLGLACWEESPVFWANEGDFIQGFTRGIYSAYWIEMVYRDYNRPCILFWGACNEPWAQQPLYDYLRDSLVFLDTHDPSRILAFASVSTHHWSQGFKDLRVCTPNTYGGTFDGNIGDYYGEIAKELQLFADANPGKPLVSMEWGMWRSGNESEQIRCFEEGFRAFSEHPNCQGMTWWLAFDYYGPNYYNAMGIYNMERTWHSPTFDAMFAAYTSYTSANL